MDRKSILLGILIGLVAAPTITWAALITTSMIADQAITTAKIKSLAVTGSRIANYAVTGPKIANQAVTGAKIANGTITKVDIAANAVTQTKIIDGAISLAKLDAIVDFLLPDWAQNPEVNVDFPAIAGGSCSEQDLSVTNAWVGETITATPKPTTNGVEDDPDTQWNAWVKVNNTVTLRVCNNDPTNATPDIAAQDWVIGDFEW